VKIVLHVERLVLEGLAMDAHAANAVRLTLIRELTHILRTDSTPPLFGRGEALPRVWAPEIALATGEAPALIGRNVAWSVHAGFSK